MRTPRPSDAREAVRKAANVAELLEIRKEAQELDSLEVAVAENALLARRLEALVEGMERSLVPLLERAVAGQPEQESRA